MSAEVGHLLLFLGCLAVVVITITAVVVAGQTGHWHRAKVRRIKAKESQAMREIDRTAEYWIGLYKYIGQRLDHESRRRQSG